MDTVYARGVSALQGPPRLQQSKSYSDPSISHTIRCVCIRFLFCDSARLEVVGTTGLYWSSSNAPCAPGCIPGPRSAFHSAGLSLACCHWPCPACRLPKFAAESRVQSRKVVCLSFIMISNLDTVYVSMQYSVLLSYILS